MRGRLVSINQLTIVIGILLAQIVNWLAGPRPAGRRQRRVHPQLLERAEGWRWMFGLTAVPVAAVLRRACSGAGKPALAGQERPDATRPAACLPGSAATAYADAALADIESTLARRDRQTCDFRDLLEPRMRQGAGPRRRAGRLPAVVRHQRDLQLRRGDLPAAGYDISDVLNNIAWTGLGQPGCSPSSRSHGGPRRPAAADAARLGRAWPSSTLPWASATHAGVKGLPMLLLVLAAIGCYAMSLAPVTWVVISRDLSQPHPRRGHVGGRLALWIACFILTYTFPAAEPARPGRHVLALRRDLRRRLRLHQVPAAGDQGQDAGADRAANWWTELSVDAGWRMPSGRLRRAIRAFRIKQKRLHLRYCKKPRIVTC